MKNTTDPIPKGFHSITASLNIKDADKAIEFYKKAFGAKEVGRIEMPDGKIMYAELDIGDSKIMLSDENIQMDAKGPKTLGGTPITLSLYVKDVDAVFAKAIKEGAKVMKNMELKDQFWGDRGGAVIDPFGYRWMIMTHIEDISFKEMTKRSMKMMEEQQHEKV